MKKRLGSILALLGMAFVLSAAQAETAHRVPCKLTGMEHRMLANASDGNYKTGWTSVGGENARIMLKASEGETIAGVYVQFFEEPCAFDVQIQEADGTWRTVGTSGTDAYLTAYAALDTSSDSVRVVAKDHKRLFIAEITALSPGDVPHWVQRWQAPLEKADMLVLAAHPDDEVLFMGGTIPYYAGERKLDVQVAFLVPSMPYRKLELLDCLWLCGVRHYPDLGNFPDRFEMTTERMYASRGWSEKRVMNYVASLYRRYRPNVVVTHDIGGEYGHGAHKVAADAARKCVALAADAAFETKDTPDDAPWQVQKLYLHLYEENALRMDWRKPLVAFDGKTAFDMAQAGFECHVSQQRTAYTVEDFGPYDNAKFGLAFSSVGADVAKDDFMEHIEEE